KILDRGGISASRRQARRHGWRSLATAASPDLPREAINKYRYAAVGKHLAGLAAQQESLHTSSPVRGHGDQVTPLLGRRFDNRLIGLCMFLQDSGARPPLLLGNALGIFQVMHGDILHVLFIRLARCSHSLRIRPEHAGRLDGREHCYFRTSRLGKSDAAFHGLPRKGRSIDRNENMLEHSIPPSGAAPPCPASSGRVRTALAHSTTPSARPTGP